MRARDSQKSKVYAAEWALLDRDRAGRERLDTVPEIQAWVDKITASAWWRKRYPRVKKITVKNGAGQRRALAFPYRQEISLPKWSRSKGIIIHEITHLVVPVSVASHGWEFCSEYLAIVKHFLGQGDHDALKAAFDKRKVRYRKPRQRAPLTDEQKAVLVERLAIARAAKEQRAAAEQAALDRALGSP